MKVNWSRSKYFNPRIDKRLACRCCGLLAPSHEIVRLINEIREEFGDVILVNSGTRCTRYNTRCKGSARDSYHIAMPARGILSEACDIRPAKRSQLSALHKACLAVLDNHGGCKRYKSFIHVDVRPGRWRARG